MWAMSNRFDRRALPLADRHYSRQKPGSPQFVPPGRCLVLLTDDACALWVSSWPLAEYTKHAWAGAWVNSLFRKECEGLASQYIREALAATKYCWGEPPPLGMVTFVDENKVRHKRDPGRCYLRAGFKPAGRTKGGLLALQIAPPDMPNAERPMMALGRTMKLFD